MRERLPLILKVFCVVLAALVLTRVAGAFTRIRPLASVTLPAVPTWSPPTNAPSGGSPETVPGPGGPPMGMPMPMGMPGSGGGASVPPPVQKRFDRIVQSGLLGQVMRPPPMALLGIAGQDVILRGPNGQMGILREGEELGGVKLLRIGTNRVLVMEGGAEKELMIFGGLGGDSLKAQSKEKTP